MCGCVEAHSGLLFGLLHVLLTDFSHSADLSSSSSPSAVVAFAVCSVPLILFVNRALLFSLSLSDMDVS